MIKSKRDRKKDEAKVTVMGETRDIIAELLSAIRFIYLKMNKHGKAAGSLFKEYIIKMVGDPNSPVWKEDESK